MAKCRLAMMGAISSCEGAWVRTRGDESRIVVHGLEEGGTVRLVAEYERDSHAIYTLTPGTHPFPAMSCRRFRLVKEASASPLPTSVEIHFDGPS